MALTPSTMVPLGTEAPAFKLPDTDGKTVSLDDFKGSRHSSSLSFAITARTSSTSATNWPGWARNIKERASPSSASAPTT